MTRRIATARDGKVKPAVSDLRKVKAFQAVFGGNGSRDDADIVLSELTALTGYFRPPSHAEWMKNTGASAGFELHCALQAARAEPIRAILNYLNMSDAQMIALEKAAREARFS